MVKPDFKIKIDGNEFKKNDLVKSIAFTDEINSVSDTVRIIFNDIHENIEIPKTGVLLELHIGYEDNLVFCGNFQIDEVIISKGKVVVGGKGFDTKKNIKMIRSRTFGSKKIGDIVSHIASENKLKATISEDIYNKETNISLVNESDMHFLTRLGEKNDALVKIQGSYLLFVSKNRKTNSQGQDISKAIKISKTLVSNYSMSLVGRSEYKKVRATYRDPETLEQEEVTAGAGFPILKLGIYNSKEEAQEDCKSFLKGTGYKTKKISLSLIGNTDLKAGLQVELSDFRTGINGTWNIEKVSHSISNGFSTNLNLAKYIEEES